MPSSGDHFINVSQIACFDSSNTNVLKNKPVSVSSAYTNTPKEWLNDGSLQNFNYPSCFHSQNATNDWALFDLQAEIDIVKCTIWLRNDCCFDRIVGAQLLLLDSSQTTIKSQTINSSNKVIDVNYN